VKVANPPPTQTTPVVAPSAPPTAGPPDEDISRHEQITNRDSLTRLAEARMADGHSEEALDLLTQALEVGRELSLRPSATTSDLIDLSLLYRRAGTLAEGLSRVAVARKYYESGRRALLELRSRERLPQQALVVLADLESRLRPARP
jgi:hypothetical protein